MRKHTIATPYMVGDVHVYSTEVGGELVLFDTGPPTPAGLEQLGREIDLKRLRHLVITHCHVDHYGLAGWVADNTDAEIYLPAKDDIKIRHHGRRLACIEGLLAQDGFDRPFVSSFRKTVEKHQVFPPVPKRYKVAEESAELASLGIGILPCPGHSQSDLVYLCGGYAVTGDVLLRGIFQAPLLDIDLDTFEGRFDNYGAYCRTLEGFEALKGLEILPGHRESVESLEATVLFYVGKLMERAGRIRALPGGLSVREMVEALFGRDSDPFIAYLKTSEIHFMKDFLAQPQTLKDALERLGLFAPLEPLYRDLV